MLPEKRHLHLRGAVSSTIRTATYQQQEHIVVDVVAMVEGVVFPVNADNPEMVYASELAKAPQGWEGRPVFCGHPQSGGDYGSGNTPELLERDSFGTVFHAATSEKVLASKRLSFEAWLNVAKATTVSADAANAIERIKNGDTVEVSVGVFVIAEQTRGNYNGKPFYSIWREIVPDHLAILPAGDVGACSVAMGCGTPRSALMHCIGKNNEASISFEGTMPEPKKSIRERLKGLIPFKASVSGVSDQELRDMIREPLAAQEPGLAYIEAVYESDGYVIYCVITSQDPSMYQEEFYRRDFSVASDGTITLDSVRTQVEPIMRFEPVAAAEGRTACGCHTQQGEVAMEKKARVTALLGNKLLPFKETDRTYLESLDDARLTELEAKGTPAAETPAQIPAQTPAQQTPAQTPAQETAVPKTAEQWMAEAPESVKKIVKDAQDREAARKSALITTLKDKAKTAYTEAELQAMDVPQLEKVALLIGIDTPAVDHSLIAPRAARQGERTGAPPAPDLNKVIRDNAQKTSPTPAA